MSEKLFSLLTKNLSDLKDLGDALDSSLRTDIEIFKELSRSRAMVMEIRGLKKSYATMSTLSAISGNSITPCHGSNAGEQLAEFIQDKNDYNGRTKNDIFFFSSNEALPCIFVDQISPMDWETSS